MYSRKFSIQRKLIFPITAHDFASKNTKTNKKGTKELPLYTEQIVLTNKQQ